MLQPTDYKTAEKLGLLPEEFERINTILARVPNFVELSIFSVMWSEHCSYKNSIVWLKTLPKKSDRMLAQAGEENAGLVDIGDNLACSFKIESHNHPSAIEPYQGAATGVGGINRDIFTMGARPIAQLNSLRFGNIDKRQTKQLLRGVVKGIGDYGNAFGIPTVGGEVYFDDCYYTNPLVNAFSAGIVEQHLTASAIAYGPGNPVYIVGSATGKDGIHGATFASGDISEDSINDLPAVQVGDPFQQKCLLEATLEIIASGNIIGIQDMGAAGIICSTAEMAAKGKHGMRIDLDKVPMRQQNMTPAEILLSESQERMLLVIKKGTEAAVAAISDKWDLNCANIGKVTDSNKLEFFFLGQCVANVPAYDLVLGGGAPVYHRSYKEPAYYQRFKKFSIDTITDILPKEIPNIAKYLLTHPNIISRRWIYEQYDSMVGTANTSTNAPGDAVVVRVKGTEKNIVITVDGNARYVQADPARGAAIAIAEAARNIVCTGGKPLAITNCLNFGNPYNEEVYWQFVQVIKGMTKACLHFSTPVTGGNVSFYNQSADGGPIFPTPVIGMLGLMDGLAYRMTMNFKSVGDLIFLLGKAHNCINSSEYLYSYLSEKESPSPAFDLDDELEIQQLTAQLIGKKRIQSAHDIADGGLFIALAESAMASSMGFSIETSTDFRRDAFLFGESQSRVVVSVNPEKRADFERQAGANATYLGLVTKDDFIIDQVVIILSADAKKLHEQTLSRLMEKQ